MTLDGFLTVLALLAAVYAVLSPVQRMRAALSWRAQVLLAVPACALILGLELFGWSAPPCLVDSDAVCRSLTLGSDDPGPARKFAFVVALAWLVAAVAVHRSTRPSLGNLPAFADLATALIDDEQYGDALKLLEPHIALLARASRGQTPRQRLRTWLVEFGPPEPGSFEAFSRSPHDRVFRGERWPRWAAAPVRALAVLVPRDRRARRSATDLMQLLLTSPRVLDYVVERRPHFAASLVATPVMNDTEFLSRFLTRMIADPSSALYHELATNDASEGLIGYRLEARNRLLHFLFANARIAERLSVWKPVGDYVNRLIEGHEGPDYPTWLNGPADEFQTERMRDPVWMALFFFDLMVTSAARQDVGYHMWLPYLPLFARRLEANYESVDVDGSAEFPNRGARLLYEIMTLLSAWTKLHSRLPEGSRTRDLPDRFEYGEIPAASALALVDVLHLAVTSTRIDPEVVQTLHTVALRTVRAFSADADADPPIRTWLIEAILRGDHGRGDRFYRMRLADLFDSEDSFYRYEMKDYEAALAAALERDAEA